MGRLGRYKLMKVFGPALVVGYCLTAFISTRYRGQELYPFFNWSLFSQSANPRADVVMIIRAVNGRQLDRPSLYFDMPQSFAGASLRLAAVAKTLDMLASAERRNDIASENKLRALVEANYLREAHSVRYDVARITYDPIERLRTGQVMKTEVIASYEKRP